MRHLTELSPQTYEILNEIFNHFEIDFSRSKNLAGQILKLSELYQNELADHSSIWRTQSLVKAYLAYYFPLNTIRSSKVIESLDLTSIDLSQLNIYDYGSGPGTSHLALINNKINFKSLHNIDISNKAIDIHKSWSLNSNLKEDIHWHNSNPEKINKSSLAIFNYAFNEMDSLPANIDDFEHILFIEPSTRQVARRLQKQRHIFSDKSYNIIAPCTHQEECPLLKHSKKDWCHNRIFFKSPDWIEKLEKYMPIKNTSLTYSYLFISKSILANNNQNRGRVIGDTQKEKGKTKQAFCRNSNREFLAWLKKDVKKPQFIERGTLIDLPDDFELKSNEIRLPH